MEGFFNDKDRDLSRRAQRLRHSIKTITGREVFLRQEGLYEHETLEYFNTDLKYNHQWHELLIFEYLGSEVKQVWHVAREITISLMTTFIGSKIIFCLVRVFLSIEMLSGGTNPVIALQPINPMGELGYFHHLKQRTKEQKLTRKRTVELCDGNTDIVVTDKSKKDLYQICVQSVSDKSVPDMTEIEIDSLD